MARLFLRAFVCAALLSLLASPILALAEAKRVDARLDRELRSLPRKES